MSGPSVAGERPPRRYPERGRRCLEAMGLVPWVAVRRVGPTDVQPSAGDAPRVPVPPVSVPPMPAERHALLDRPMAAFVRRGATVLETGHRSARVLIVVERGPDTPPDGSPLAGEAASLLQLMLRAIGLERTDVSLCLPAPAGAAGPPLSELLGGARRTLLLLVHDVEDADGGVGELDGDEALRALGLAAWRVPHPALLLERPPLKRDAWQALKGVRRRLEELAA